MYSKVAETHWLQRQNSVLESEMQRNDPHGKHFPLELSFRRPGEEKKPELHDRHSGERAPPSDHSSWMRDIPTGQVPDLGRAPQKKSVSSQFYAAPVSLCPTAETFYFKVMRDTSTSCSLSVFSSVVGMRKGLGQRERCWAQLPWRRLLHQGEGDQDLSLLLSTPIIPLRGRLLGAFKYSSPKVIKVHKPENLFGTIEIPFKMFFFFPF